MKLVCVQCGIPFETIYPAKKYCSILCSNRATDRRYREKHGHNRIRSRMGRNRNRNRRAKDFVYEDKVAKGCSHCRERRPSCLQYHHIDASTKVSEISRLVKGSTYDSVVKEVDKCILLCANCHAIEEHGDGFRSSRDRRTNCHRSRQNVSTNRNRKRQHKRRKRT